MTPTGWCIEYVRGDSSTYIDHSTYSRLRADAWRKWQTEMNDSSESWRRDEYLKRRRGQYRAVKVSLQKC